MSTACRPWPLLEVSTLSRSGTKSRYFVREPMRPSYSRSITMMSYTESTWNRTFISKRATSSSFHDPSQALLFFHRCLDITALSMACMGRRLPSHSLYRWQGAIQQQHTVCDGTSRPQERFRKHCFARHRNGGPDRST